MTHPSPSSPSASRRRWWIAPSVLVLGLYAGFFAFAVAQACYIGNVYGYAGCVVQNNAHQYTAYFGYQSKDANTVNEPVGQYNGFPGPNSKWLNLGQPTSFTPGDHPYAFSTPFADTQTLAWHVSNHSPNISIISLNASSPQCGPTIIETPKTQTITFGHQASFTANLSFTNSDIKHSVSNLPQMNGSVAFIDIPGTPASSNPCQNSASGKTLSTQSVKGSYGGMVSTNTTSLAPGAHTVCAIYSDAFYSTILDSVTVQVNLLGSTCQVAASSYTPVYNQAVTFMATVGSTSGVPTGKVDFSDVYQGQTKSLGQGTLSSNVATAFADNLGIGSHTITANYEGDTTHAVPTEVCQTSLQVDKIPTTTTVVSSQNPTVSGQGVTFTATVAPVAPNTCTLTGQVTFTIPGAKPDTETVIGGKATTATPITTLALGATTITAVYSGDATCVTSTGTTTQTVGTVPPPPSGSTNSFIRIAQTASAPVDVTIDTATSFPGLGSCTVGNYYPLSAGSHTFTVAESGKPPYKQSITFTPGDYYTLAFVDDPIATPVVAQNLVVFQDNLSVVPGQAKARVYHLSDSTGPISVATNGTLVVTSLSFENASSYLTQDPGTVNYTFTPLSNPTVAQNKPITEAANQIYSFFWLCGKVQETTIGGIPTALPQTGFAPVIPGTNWNAIAFLMGALAIIGAGLGGISGLAVVQYRRRHR